MYCWVAMLSFIHFGKDKKNPFKSEPDEMSKMESKQRSFRNPFSRSSTLSLRGRRSFLLKANKSAERHQSKGHNESESFLGHSNQEESSNFSTEISFNRDSTNPNSPANTKQRRVGGFVPELLKSSKFSEENSILEEMEPVPSHSVSTNQWRTQKQVFA